MNKKFFFFLPLLLTLLFLLPAFRANALVIDFNKIWNDTGFHNLQFGNFAMLLVGVFLIFLAIKFEYKPLILIPMGVGILIGNIPFAHEAIYPLGVYKEGSVMNILYQGVLKGIYPSLVFLGIGAMTDFSSLISNP